jgi:selenoprotein W-related protein
MKPQIEIEYCPGCRWLLRAGWTAQELLTTFERELAAVTLRPAELTGTFRVTVDGHLLWDRKSEGRFPEMKELKQRVRDHIAPELNLGHSDTEERKHDVS